MYNFLRTYIVKIHYTVSSEILQDVFEKKLRQKQQFGKEWLDMMQQIKAPTILDGALGALWLFNYRNIFGARRFD